MGQRGMAYRRRLCCGIRGTIDVARLASGAEAAS